MTRNIPQSDWAVELQGFTQRNSGRATVIDELAPHVGAQEAEHGFPLRGVSFDRRAGQVEIMLGELAGTEHHITRGISDVRNIAIWTADDGHDHALRIERAAGVTILRFESFR